MDITTNVNDISSNNNNATKQAPSSPPSSPRTHDENVIEHTVTSSDTLVGLSLKYNASVCLLIIIIFIVLIITNKINNNSDNTNIVINRYKTSND